MPAVTRRENVRKRASEADDDDDETSNVERRGSHIFFYADVNVATVLKLSRLLDEAANDALASCVAPRNARVWLWLHSSGGDAYAGMTAMDMVGACKVPVWTIATGLVASAATFILLGGTRSFGTPHCTILVHEVSVHGFEGKFKDLVDEMQNSKSLMTLIKNLYLTRSRLTEDDLEALLRKETTFQFEDARQNGFIEGEPPGRRARSASGDGWCKTPAHAAQPANLPMSPLPMNPPQVQSHRWYNTHHRWA